MQKGDHYLVIYVCSGKQSRIVSGSRRLGVVKRVINARFCEDAGAPPRDAFKTRKSISSRGFSPARPNLDGHVVSAPISGNISARYINQRRALLLCSGQKAQRSAKVVYRGRHSRWPNFAGSCFSSGKSHGPSPFAKIYSTNLCLWPKKNHNSVNIRNEKYELLHLSLLNIDWLLKSTYAQHRRHSRIYRLWKTKDWRGKLIWYTFNAWGCFLLLLVHLGVACFRCFLQS